MHRMPTYLVGLVFTAGVGAAEPYVGGFESPQLHHRLVRGFFGLELAGINHIRDPSPAGQLS